MLQIIADDKIPFLKGALEPFARIQYIPGNQINNSHVKDADALIIRTRTICNKQLLEGSKLKCIATATIGFDHIDIDYCNSRGIKWFNAPGCNSGSVMQYIASALVRLSKKHHFNLSDKTIGVIGFGNVGSKVAKLASLLGMKVLINDPPLERKGELQNYSSFFEIIKCADIISLHVPLSIEGIDKTYHLVGEEVLNDLKPGAILINSARGEVVDNKSLKRVIIENKIGGTVLDVWENEPQIDPVLLSLVDYATPHIAGYSVDGKANGTSMSVRSISEYFKLGIKNWFPKDIPRPKESVLKIENKNKGMIETLSEAILSTYDIEKDDFRFRNSINTFEQQRATYPNRFEFINYSFEKNSDLEFIEIVKEMGFKIDNQ